LSTKKFTGLVSGHYNNRYTMAVADSTKNVELVAIVVDKNAIIFMEQKRFNCPMAVQLVHGENAFEF